MKKNLLILISLVVLFSASSCKNDENKKGENDKFHSSEYKFKVSFPGNPSIEKEQEPLEGFFVQTFLYELNDKGYMIVGGRMNDLYVEIFKGEEAALASNIRDATLQELNGTLTKQENKDFKGSPANFYDAEGFFEGVNFNIKGVNLIKGNYIYVLIVFRKDAEVEEKDYKDFINSFEVVQ